MEGVVVSLSTVTQDPVTISRGVVNIPVSVWLDGIKAVPTIGILTVNSFETAFTWLARLKPLLQRWQHDHGVQEVDAEDSKVLKIQREDGLIVTLSSTTILVGWRYFTETRDKGGANLPQLEVKTAIRPFQNMLADLLPVLKDVLGELYKDGSRQVRRIGIVAEGGMDRDALPPGVDTYVRFLGSIWSGDGVDLNGYITASLGETDEFSDRCHHFINKVSSEEDMVPIKLDWQRTFAKTRSPSINKLVESVEVCSSAASTYFDKFGLGDLNYER